LPGILQNKGWQGNRYVNANVWPQDITESCSSDYGVHGIDSAYGDAFDLLVVSGHGNTGMIGYGNVHNSMCTVEFAQYPGTPRHKASRGSAKCRAAEPACHVAHLLHLRKDKLASRANYQWVKQQIGFHGESAFDNDMIGFLRVALGPARSRRLHLERRVLAHHDGGRAWLVHGRQLTHRRLVRQHLGGSEQQPRQHDNGRLGHEIATSGAPACSSGLPRFYYTYTVIDHGTTGCN